MNIPMVGGGLFSEMNLGEASNLINYVFERGLDS